MTDLLLLVRVVCLILTLRLATGGDVVTPAKRQRRRTAAPAESPCAYPNPQPSRQKCGIDDFSIRKYNICDPQSSISHSEVVLLNEYLDHTYSQKDLLCICSARPKPTNLYSEKGGHTPCWYKFGFAFLKELKLPVGVDSFATAVNALPQSLNRSRGNPCSTANRLNRPSHLLPSTTASSSASADAKRYGKQFARALREKWHIGECGEDIIFLVVKRRPVELMPEGRLEKRYPYIFVSWGDMVTERTRQLDQLRRSRIDTLDSIIDRLNKQLLQGYSLKEVFSRLVADYTSLLTVADQTYGRPGLGGHIPSWATMTFAACGGILLLTIVGLCLEKTGMRRSLARSKTTGGEPNRKWKAGFVGDVLAVMNTGDDGAPHTQSTKHTHLIFFGAKK